MLQQVMTCLLYTSNPQANILEETVDGRAGPIGRFFIADPLQGGIKDTPYLCKLCHAGGIRVTGKLRIDCGKRLSMCHVRAMSPHLHAQSMGQRHPGGSVCQSTKRIRPGHLRPGFQVSSIPNGPGKVCGNQPTAFLCHDFDQRIASPEQICLEIMAKCIKACLRRHACRQRQRNARVHNGHLRKNIPMPNGRLILVLCFCDDSAGSGLRSRARRRSNGDNGQRAARGPCGIVQIFPTASLVGRLNGNGFRLSLIHI